MTWFVCVSFFVAGMVVGVVLGERPSAPSAYDGPYSYPDSDDDEAQP